MASDEGTPEDDAVIPSITAVRLSGAAGRHELPLLVLGPAEGSSALSCWRACATLLADDFDLLAWDLPGHGYNTGPSADPGAPASLPGLPDLADGVLSVVDDVLAERGEPGRTDTAFAYVGVGVGASVGRALLDVVPARVLSMVEVPDDLDPSESPAEVAALIGVHMLGRPIPDPAADPAPEAPDTGSPSLVESPQRRRTDDLTDAQYDALRGLTDALRELNLAGATTALPTEAILEQTRAVHATAAALSRTDVGGDGWPHPVDRITRTHYETPQRMTEEGRMVRVNDLNPLHPGIDVRIDAAAPLVGRNAAAEVTLDALHEGPPECAHGGTIAFLMDSMLGILVQSAAIPAVTGSLTTRYLARTPLEQPLSLGSRIVGRQGRKISVESWVEVDGTRTVEATATFIEVALAQDAGDPA